MSYLRLNQASQEICVIDVDFDYPGNAVRIIQRIFCNGGGSEQCTTFTLQEAMDVAAMLAKEFGFYAGAK